MDDFENKQSISAKVQNINFEMLAKTKKVKEQNEVKKEISR